MSAAPKIQRRSSGSFFAVALVTAVVAGAGSYYALVVREDQAAAKAKAEADGLQAEIDRAKAYLAGRPDDKQSLVEIHEAAGELAKRVPVGRKDIAVAQYAELRAADAGISDFKYEVVGGMALPDDKPQKEKAPEDRLGVEPLRLQSQLISMEFSARYPDFVKFEKALAEAPWLLELVELGIKRDKTNTVSAHVTVRYLYQ